MAAAALVATLPQGAVAQKRAGDALDSVTACTRIAADAERLACFDRAAASLVSARAAKEIVVLDKEEVRRTKRSLFGFSLPSIRLLGEGEALKEVKGVMRSSAPLAGGMIRFELDGGGVWESTEQVVRGPRPGDEVTIRAGSLGSYTATAPGRRSARVRRIR